MITGLKDNRLSSVWKWFFDSLSDIYDKNELKSIRKNIFEHYFNLAETDVILKDDLLLTETEIVILIKAINKLKQQRPLQYITAKAYFLDYVLDVTENTLIPRPETEELVLLAINQIKQHFHHQDLLKILDVGTGSGCIAISVADKIKNAELTAIDICENALKTAQQNAKKAEVSVNFMKFDILGNDNLSEVFDVIISNPPYVRNSEKSLMNKNVLDYEPGIALFVEDDNPLIFYEKICKNANEGLIAGNGLIFFEINENLGKETADLLQQYGFKNIQIHKDMRNKDRFISAKKIT